MIRVLLVDDHPVVRAGLRALLDGQVDITVAAEAGGGREAIELNQQWQPDVVLCDLRLGVGLDGVEVTRALRAGQAHRPHVVILTTFDHDEDIIRAVEAGASGYLLKDAAAQEIIEAIRTAQTGGTVIGESMAERYVAASRRRPIELSPREREVLTLLSQGESNRAIARSLFVSEATVKTHVAHILGKLGAGNRTAAVAVARERGLVD